MFQVMKWVGGTQAYTLVPSMPFQRKLLWGKRLVSFQVDILLETK